MPGFCRKTADSEHPFGTNMIWIKLDETVGMMMHSHQAKKTA